MLQKIRFFDKKDPKLSLSELLSWMTIFKSIHMAFYVNTSWACALLRNNKQHVVLGQKRNCRQYPFNEQLPFLCMFKTSLKTPDIRFRKSKKERHHSFKEKRKLTCIDNGVLNTEILYLRYLCLLVYSGTKYIFCCVLVLVFFNVRTQCCQILWIVHFLWPLWYSLTLETVHNLSVTS